MANVGTVQSVTGLVRAIAEDGTERILSVGDTVAENEKIITGDGVIVIAFTDGTILDLGSNSNIVLNDDVLNQESEQTAQSRSEAESEVAALQEALANDPNFDPSTLPATAAGPAAGGTDGNNGHTVVSVDYLNPTAPVEAGFDTIGISQAFLQPDEELPPVELEEVVTVSVSVSVQVEVGVDIDEEPNPDEKPPYIPDDFPGEDGESVFVNSHGAVVLEGTDDGDEETGDEFREVTFILSLDKLFESDVLVTYQLQPVVNGDGSDYPEDWVDGTLDPQQILIPAGTTEIPVSVLIRQDHLDEGNGNFNIVLLAAESEGGIVTINPAADTAFITIFDDDTTPEANPDTNFIDLDSGEDYYVKESQLLDQEMPLFGSTTGNVLNNIDHTFDPTPGDDGDEVFFEDMADTDEDGDALVVTGVIAHGEDGALSGGDDTVGSIGDPLAGKWGTLTLQSDGSYEYVAGPATSELTFGQEETDQFTYTVTDTYNQPQTTTLTITIFGGDSGVEIRGVDNLVVDEDGLKGAVVDASRPGETDSTESATATGNFIIDAPDGVGSVTIDGHLIISGGVLVASPSFITGLGNTFTVTGYNAITGEVTYQYTLESNEDHPTANQEDSVFETFPVVLTDTDGDSANSSISVEIVDDIPVVDIEVSSEGAVVTDETSQLSVAVTGSTSVFSYVVAAAAGADGGTTVVTLSITSAATGLKVTDGGYPITLVEGSSDSEVIGQYTDGDDVLQTAFTVSIDSDGVLTVTQNVAMVHPESPNEYDEAVDLAGELSAVVTVTDGDLDVATDSVAIGDQITFEDDGPTVIAPEVAYVTNSGSASALLIPLDFDNNVDDNYGADQPGTVTFANIAVSGTDSGQTAGGSIIYLYTNGTIVIGSTLVAGTYADAIHPDNVGNKVFTVDLNLDSDLATMTDSYSVTMFQQIDGATATFDTSDSIFDITGGNTNYTFYTDTTGVNPTALVTPSGDGTSINTSDNGIGIKGGGNGLSIGTNETIRVSYVDTVSGVPLSNLAYVEPADHTLGDNVTVNGATAGFLLNNGTTDVAIRAYDDDDDDDMVSDGTLDVITTVVVGGVNFIIADGNDTKSGYSVTWNVDGSVLVEGIGDGDQVQVFTEDGLTTVEYQYVAGTPFLLSGFGAAIPVPGELLRIDLDLEVEDGDGDTVIVEDAIVLSISPDDHVIIEGTPGNDDGVDSLDATPGQAATLIGYAGNDSLNGADLNDILVGGLGSDTMSGGTESDTFVWNAGDAAGSPADIITDFNDAGETDVLDLSDLLIGEESGTLTDYLSVNESGGAVVINVSTEGGAGDSQVITLENTTFVDLGITGATQADIVDQMISLGHINIDS
ncbi:retention module-containing protein [Cycloclasticus pugetii]|uniref:retention module-containing protein n=1 Tax=Cycloclasticus pugetii TaxID=34068 RepID=UPI00035E4CCD|nr:retention module-containing protein [Cycloclasticus pugetii]